MNYPNRWRQDTSLPEARQEQALCPALLTRSGQSGVGQGAVIYGIEFAQKR